MSAVICARVICCTNTMRWHALPTHSIHARMIHSGPRMHDTTSLLQSLGIGLMSPVQRVVLIDEIDKAPRDLPNDLLREMDQGSFTIPEIPEVAAGTIQDSFANGIELRRRMQRPTDAPRPLVIVTSNAERQLPDAFLRRCVFFHIPFPEEADLQKILRERFPWSQHSVRAVRSSSSECRHRRHLGHQQGAARSRQPADQATRHRRNHRLCTGLAGARSRSRLAAQPTAFGACPACRAPIPECRGASCRRFTA
jgi:MoxR-like ATPase